MTVKYIYEVHVPVFGKVRRGTVLKPGTQEEINFKFRMTNDEYYDALWKGDVPLPRDLIGTIKVTSPDDVTIIQRDRIGGEVLEREFATLHKKEITGFGKKYEINGIYKLRWEPTLPQKAKR